MADIETINRFLQRELGKGKVSEVVAVEAATWLDRRGLLKDSASRPGRPLRDLLRAGKIWGGHQYSNQRWVIRRIRSAGPASRANSADIGAEQGRHETALARALRVYDKRFATKGSFRLRRGENLRDCIRRNQVPEIPAVYLIYAVRRRRSELLYIGKSGTVRTNGTLKGQGLATRLRMKQGKKWRAEFYTEEMRRLRLSALEFRWWGTFDRTMRILPAWSEAELFQTYFDDHQRLPPWNLAV